MQRCSLNSPLVHPESIITLSLGNEPGIALIIRRTMGDFESAKPFCDDRAPNTRKNRYHFASSILIIAPRRSSLTFQCAYRNYRKYNKTLPGLDQMYHFFERSVCVSQNILHLSLFNFKVFLETLNSRK